MTHRVTQVLTQPVTVSPATARVTQVFAQPVTADKTLPIRVTQLFAQAVGSLDQGIRPAAIPAPTTFFGIESATPNIDPLQPQTFDREANPFRPDLGQPTSPRVPGMINEMQPQRVSIGMLSGSMESRPTPAQVFAPFPVAEPQQREDTPAPKESPAIAQVQKVMDSVRESQELLRATHEKAQAGDTTVPWEFLTRLSTEQLFTPGSLGRFYHDDFGIILARYVKFVDMNPALRWVNAPVGRLRDADTFAWEVTNRFDKSSAFLAEGIIAAYRMPRDGQYGWVTVSGANHTRLLLKSTPRPTQWQNLAWLEDEALGGDVAGTILGYVVSAGGSTKLDPGRVFIQVGGATRKHIESYFDASLLEIQAIFDEIEQRIVALEGSENPQSLAQLTSEVAQLRANLEREAASRASADRALNSRFDSLNALTEDSLATYDTSVRQYINNQDSALSARITTAQNQASAALTAVGNIPDYAASIQRIDDALVSALARLTGLMVRHLGQGPIANRPATPNPEPGATSLWLATDTNVLSAYDAIDSVWVNITGGGGAAALNDLTDVDTATTPPATGNVLRFNGTQWVPTVPTGGSASPSAYAAVVKNTNQTIGGAIATITYQTVLADTNGLWNAATNSFIIPSSLNGRVAMLSFQSQATSDSNGFLEGWIERSLDGGATWTIVGWSANGGIDHFGIASSAFVDQLVTGASYRVRIQIQAGATLLGNNRNRFAIGIV